MKHKPSFESSSNPSAKTSDTEKTDHTSAHTTPETAGEKHHKRHSEKHHDTEHIHAQDKKHEKEPLKTTGKKTEKTAEKPKDSPEATQEKRSDIIERSRQFKKLYEEVPVPRDPQVLAQLLVADHILAINKEIEEPDPKAPVDKNALHAALDSMGELADKLENPERESTPELQEAYEAVIQLAKHVLSENEPVNTIIDANANQARAFDFKHATSPSVPTPEHADRPAHTTSTTALIGFLMQQRSSKPAHRSSIAIAPAMPYASDDFGSDTSPNSQTVSSSQPATSATAAYRLPVQPEVHLSPSLSPTEARAAYRENARAEHRTPVRLGSPNRIASLAVVSTLAALHHEEASPLAPSVASTSHAYEQPQPPPRSSPDHFVSTSSSAKNDYAELASVTRAHAAPVAQHVETLRPSGGVGHSLETTYSSNRKLEHRTLQELLSMAEVVPVGHGQRLRKMYEKGQIDKEGLIKVLKSRSRNQDYIKEFRQQVAQRKNLIESSPEFLTSIATDDTTFEPRSTRATNHESSDRPPAEPKILPFLPNDLKETLSGSPTALPPTGFNNPPPASTPWLPIIGISLLVIAAGVLIFFLLMG